MINYGIELEFFVLNQKDEVIPAYKVTSNIDGNPIIGELRTKVHNNIIDCVFELKKLIFLEKQKIELKGFKIDFSNTKILKDDLLVEMRKTKEYIDKKENTVLEELSVYDKGNVGKMLPKGVYKASLQLNISNNKEISYLEYTKITIEDKFKYESKNCSKSYSSVFDFPKLICKLDKTFQNNINDSKRVKGVYAIKEGELGDRIEYRSLPNDIDLDLLIKTLK